MVYSPIISYQNDDDDDDDDDDFSLLYHWDNVSRADVRMYVFTRKTS